MADKKITDLTAATSFEDADLIEIVDSSEIGGGDPSRKLTKGQLFDSDPDFGNSFTASGDVALNGDTGDGPTLKVASQDTGVNTSNHLVSLVYELDAILQDGSFFMTFEDAAGVIGSITSASTSSAVAYNTTSDYRLKENVSDASGCLAKILQLAIKQFSFKKDPDSTLHIGVLAHEAQAVVPEAVTGEKDKMIDEVAKDEKGRLVRNEDGSLAKTGNKVMEPQMIDYSKLVPLLIGAIQELEARVTALEA